MERDISTFHQKLLESNAELQAQMKEVLRRLSVMEVKYDLSTEKYATKEEVHSIREDVTTIKNRLWGIIITLLTTIIGAIFGFFRIK